MRSFAFPWGRDEAHQVGDTVSDAGVLMIRIRLIMGDIAYTITI